MSYLKSLEPETTPVFRCIFSSFQLLGTECELFVELFNHLPNWVDGCADKTGQASIPDSWVVRMGTSQEQAQQMR